MKVPPGLFATSHLALDRCPHCKRASPTIARKTDFQVTPASDPRGGNAALHWLIYACASCGGLVGGAVRANVAGTIESRQMVWLVPTVYLQESTLPSRVAHYLKQAEETMHSPSASIVMSASAVDAMLKESGYKTGTLYGRIEKAANDGKFTGDMALWAHEVRLDANDERHADELAAMPSMTDAQRALDFAETLAEILFVLPARVRKGLKKDSA